MTNPFEVIESRLSNIERLLLDIKHPPQVQVTPPDDIDTDEASIVTKLAKSSIYKLSMTGEIPVRKFGKRLVFSRRELLDWLNSNTVHKYDPEAAAIDQLKREGAKRTRA